jgi:dienelactone hydrolase
MRWSMPLSFVLLASTLSCSEAAQEPTEPPCTTTKRPIVAVHGFLASGDTYATQAQRFADNGYCLRSVHAFDWNTLGEKKTEDNVAELDAFIDEVRKSEGVDKVDLMGHSAGGGLGYSYLADPTRAAKVAHYAHLASFRQPDQNTPARPAGPNGEVPTLNVYSDADLIVQDKGDIPGATNVHLTTSDHYATATGPETFAALYRFFNDGEEAKVFLFKKVPSPPNTWISGKALTLGGNQPEVGAIVEVYRLDETGERSGSAWRSFTTNAKGEWGPLALVADSSSRFEMVVKPKDPDAKAVHYYFEPFTRSNHLLRLRTIPNDQGIAGSLLSTVNYDDAHSVVIAFVANRGVIAGRDTLSINGFNVATEELAPASKNAIAFFAYDANGNGASENTAISTFANFPFMGAIDSFMDTTKTGPIQVKLNDSTLNVRRWKSATEGPIVAVFND